MQFSDTVTITGVRETSDGYLVADSKVARSGMQTYLGTEVGRPEMATVRVYRPADEVFSNDSLASFAHKPVTIDHPAQGVTAATWRTLAVGHLGDTIARDGDFVRVPLIIMDSNAISDIKDGKRELSAGYTCDLVFEDGVSPDGDKYDAVQKGIKVNHVAIVARGRAGSKARIGDGWGQTPLEDEKEVPMTTRNVLVDGLMVETTDAGAVAIEKLVKDVATLTAKVTDAATAHGKAIAAKDEEIGTLKADLVKAKDAAPNAADLDKMVVDRVALVTTARAIKADIKVEGVSDADLRKAVVISRMGDAAVKDASDAEITGMFKALSRDVDPMKDAFTGRTVNTADTAVKTAYDKMIADMSTAHKPQAAA